MSDLSSNILFDLPKNKSASIKVIGVGGGGSNAVNYMYEEGITGVDFVVCNTDAQALNNSSVPNKIQLGASITEGLGAGANPEIGEQAAIESLEEIKSLLNENTKMVFITAGMGGGTGTGAAPVIAGIARDLGILVVGIVTIPFYFEGKRRTEQAEEGINKLRKYVDSLIVINNNKLRELYGNLGYKSGFAKADEVLTTASKGIAEVITHHYRQNIDLKDAKTVLSNSGTAIMGSAKATGENRAHQAIADALDSPLLNDNKITGAKNVLLLIVSGNNEVTLDEIGIINDYIQSEAGHNANIIMGIGEEPALDDAIAVTIVATGFPIDDQRYTGKEEEKIFHTLVEDQVISKKMPVTNNRVNTNLNAHLTQKSQEKVKIHVLEEEEENKPTHFFTPSQQKNLDETSFSHALFDLEEFNNTHQPTENKTNEEVIFESKKMALPLAEKEEIRVFSLEDDFEEEKEAVLFDDEFQFQLKNPEIETKPNSIIVDKEQEEISPFDTPINKALQDSIEERRKRLKKFNYQFSSSIQQNSANLSSPAFARQGVELNEKTESKPSQYIIGEGKNNETIIKPNGFLHNNAD
jgi:cell division protein FtsZ